MKIIYQLQLILALILIFLIPNISQAKCVHTQDIAKNFDQILAQSEFMRLESKNDKNNFVTLDKIITSSQKQPLLIMFWHRTCKPCKQESRMIEMIHDAFAKDLKFIAFYTHDDNELSKANATKEYKKFYQSLKRFGLQGNKIVPDNYITMTGSDSLLSVKLYNFLLYYGLMKQGNSERKTYQKSCVHKKKASLPIPRFILLDANHHVVLAHEGTLLSSLNELLSFIDQIKATLQ